MSRYDELKALRDAFIEEYNLGFNNPKTDPNVNGIGIGLGDKPGEFSIAVNLIKDKPHSLPATYRGVPVRVKVVGEIIAY